MTILNMKGALNYSLQKAKDTQCPRGQSWVALEGRSHVSVEPGAAPGPGEGGKQGPVIPERDG
ncbi:MAG: hypothetical protein O7E53_02635 [Alphaproteobacteria bacterium]|nr:hypothetical protein [Alphaproteobacteria bacterium]